MQQPKADIQEVFSSIQGEGIYLGARQIFLRFKGCNMNCVFCDEDLRDLEPKIYSPLELMREINFLEEGCGPHHSVSLTGGEPLLYTEFLKEFLKLLKRGGFKTYLETNGTLPKELEKVIDSIDIVAMDFKLPSSTGQTAYWNEHLEFLKTAVKKKAFVKIVITPNTIREDIEKAVSVIETVGKHIPLILQPATPSRPLDEEVDSARLLSFLDIASKGDLVHVKILPQVHKILNVR